MFLARRNIDYNYNTLIDYNCNTLLRTSLKGTSNMIRASVNIKKNISYAFG